MKNIYPKIPKNTLISVRSGKLKGITDTVHQVKEGWVFLSTINKRTIEHKKKGSKTKYQAIHISNVNIVYKNKPISIRQYNKAIKTQTQ